jgi:hypothetical protein
MVQVKQDGLPAVTKRYTHCERRYGQYDWGCEFVCKPGGEPIG